MRAVAVDETLRRLPLCRPVTNACPISPVLLIWVKVSIACQMYYLLILTRTGLPQSFLQHGPIATPLTNPELAQTCGCGKCVRAEYVNVN